MKTKDQDAVIIGSGIAGLACGHVLKKNRLPYSIYEMGMRWGGLCDFFNVGEFRFDRFIHLSFSKLDYVNNIFFDVPHYKHKPVPYNHYSGYWIKHPAQSNLFNLSAAEKEKIIDGFIHRPNVPLNEIENYETWLRCQYGDYFAENFPMRYTRKYWTTEAGNLETKWVGARMYKPTLGEIKESCFSEITPNRYYAEEMRYPRKGGYKSFLSSLAQEQDIFFNKKVVAVDVVAKKVTMADGEIVGYGTLISSIPLPEYSGLIEGIPTAVMAALDKLAHTSGVLVSLGFNRPDVAKHLWVYFYDEDILPARVYSPSLKSPDNVPPGCSSLQAEIFYSKKYRPLKVPLEEIREKTIDQLSASMGFSRNDIACVDVRYEPYANVIFDHDIYKCRKLVLDYLREAHIVPIGRFGEWEYFWSDQSLMSGVHAAKKVIGDVSYG